MRKSPTSFFILILVAVLVVGCGATNDASSPGEEDDGQPSSSDPKEGGTLVVGASGDPQTFNPDARADDNFYAIAQNVFSRLIKINNNQEIIPDLAKEWDVSEDGTEITFHLHENVKWHDGEDFTSADVKFTLDSIQEHSGYAVGNLSSMDEVLTPDDNTVVIKLSKPDATFLGYLAWYATFILPEHVYSGDNWDSGTNIEPVGTGPFKFVEYNTGVNVTLERNEDYFGQVPYVDRVVFSIISDADTMVQSFYNGELDILGVSPPSSEAARMIDDPDIIAEPQLWPSRQYIVFNFDEEPFDQLEVRQAVAHAINNEEVVTRALKGEGQASEHFVSPVYEWALSDDYKLPEYNPDKTKELLEQVGYTPDQNGYYLSIEFELFESGSFVDIATVVQDQLRQAGIDVTLNVKEYAAWQEHVREGRNYQMSMLGGYQGPDVGAVAHRIASEGANNFMGYNSPELDQALVEGSELVTEEDRAPKYIEVQRILSEDLPIYPISEWVGISPVHSYVKGGPNSDEVIGYTGFSEYTYVWLDQ